VAPPRAAPAPQGGGSRGGGGNGSARGKGGRGAGADTGTGRNQRTQGPQRARNPRTQKGGGGASQRGGVPMDYGGGAAGPLISLPDVSSC
jgi:hypothetical protein